MCFPPIPLQTLFPTIHLQTLFPTIPLFPYSLEYHAISVTILFRYTGFDYISIV